MEYYRQHFDSTYHPIVYTLINQLSEQAKLFMKCSNYGYDRFLLECYSSNNPNIHKSPNTLKVIKANTRWMQYARTTLRYYQKMQYARTTLLYG